MITRDESGNIIWGDVAIEMTLQIIITVIAAMAIYYIIKKYTWNIPRRREVVISQLS